MRDSWRLVCLRKAEPLMAQTFYEAVALAVDRGLSANSLVLCQPSSPYVCIGFHQDLDKEVDLGYCRRLGLPIIRRSQGGGATYLNADQIFYQLVAHRRDRVIPVRVEELFETVLAAPVRVYRELGLQAEFKPLNDIVVGGRKISGNGAGLIGSAVVLVGNIILDLDYDSMSRVLKVPDEKFRDKMAKSMVDWVTSLRKELGWVPDAEKIYHMLMRAFEDVLNVDFTVEKPSEEENLIWEREVRPRHLSTTWLGMSTAGGSDSEGRAVKVAGDVHVIEVDHKARKLVRVRAELVGDRIRDISVTGDFFLIPEDAILILQKKLVGAVLNEDDLDRRVRSFFAEGDVQMPGISPEDLVDALMKLRSRLP